MIRWRPSPGPGRIAGCSLLVVGAVLAAAAARAGEPATAPAPEQVLIAVVTEACPAVDEAPLAGVKAFIDPKTGQLRPPTPEEERELASAGPAGARLKGAVVFKALLAPNGMLSLVLGDEFMNDVVVRQSPDGGMSYVCVPAPQSGKALADAPPAPLEER